VSSRSWLSWLLLGTLVTSGEARACQVLATGLSFGTYDSTAARPAFATASLRLKCPAPAILRLNAGLHPQGGSAGRQLSGAGSSEQLRYALSLDPTSIRIRGAGDADTLIHQVPAGVSTLTIYGALPGGQHVPVGSYLDSVGVTLEW
jgi:spore coat protein U-like protein